MHRCIIDYIPSNAALTAAAEAMAMERLLFLRFCDAPAVADSSHVEEDELCERVVNNAYKQTTT